MHQQAAHQALIVQIIHLCCEDIILIRHQVLCQVMNCAETIQIVLKLTIIVKEIRFEFQTLLSVICIAKKEF